MKVTLIISIILYQYLCADKLLFIQAMWRHGSRTPVNCNWNCEYFLQNDLLNGYLTPTGMRQHFVLGQWMRKRYITELQFLSDTYDASQILVYSTDVNRTIMSAMSNLQGMYSNNGPKVPNVKDSYLIPPNPGAETPTDIGQSAIQHDIQVLPIHMKEAITDDRLLSILICPKGYEMFVQNMQTNLTIAVSIKAQSTLLQFCNEMNIDPLEFNIFTLTEYMDTFYSCIYNDYPMPPNLTKETYLKVDSLYALTIALQLYQTQHQVDVFSSPFFESLLSYFDSALTQQADKNQKYIIYSAHDINVQLIASALNFTSAECMAQVYLGQEVSNKNCIYTYPGFASNIIWELWEEEQTHDHYIKVLYNGTEMNICNTDSKKCSYKIFKQLIENQRRDFQKECSVEIEPIIEEKVPVWMITLSIIFLFILFSMILYILCLSKKLRENGKTKLNEDKEP